MENRQYYYPEGKLTPNKIERVENKFKKMRRQANTWERLNRHVPSTHYEQLYAYDKWLAQNRLGWVLNYPQLDQIITPATEDSTDL